MRDTVLKVLVALLSAHPVATAAERVGERKEEAGGRLTLETERVVVFKDGYALLVKQARAVADARGLTFTEEVPDNAVLGTFWAWTDKGPPLRALRAEWREQEVEREERAQCTDPASLLEANPGKRVTVELEGSTVTGTVVPLPNWATAPVSPLPARPGRSAMLDTSGDLSGARPPGQVVALSVQGSGTVVLAGKDIRRVTGADLSLDCKRKVRVMERRKRLSLDFGPEAAGKSLSVRILYFTPGLRWIPTWRLDLKKGGEGTLALQAEVLNELEDLRGAPFDLVVGVPNFRFREVASPLSLEGVVRNALAQAAPSAMGTMNSLSNAMFTQRAGEWRGGEEEDAGPRIPEFGGTSESTDLFIHPLPAMDLAKGARAVVPLWSGDVPTRDLYTLDVRVRRSSRDQDTVQSGLWGASMGSASPSPSPLQLSMAQVWHQLELKNGTKTPWTTGPVLVMRGPVPQAQELLTYTGRGGETLIPLTIATDVRAYHEEVEVERKANALESKGSRYALVRKKGSIQVSNPRGDRTPLRVRVSVGGKVERVSDGGHVKVDDFRGEDWDDTSLAVVNNHSEVEWTLTLEPGERKTLTYDVGFYR